MTAADLPNYCNLIGVRLWVEDGQLHFVVREGDLDDDLRAELVAHKAELVELLAAPPPGPAERIEAAAAVTPDPLAGLQGPRWTPWRTWCWSDPAEPSIELFGDIPDPSIGTAMSSSIARPVRWRCLSPFCRDGSRWWLSACGLVLCRNCVPPAFPELIVAQGTLADAPLVDPDRSTTTVGVKGGDHAA
jgi:hypothetical protein